MSRKRIGGLNKHEQEHDAFTLRASSTPVKSVVEPVVASARRKRSRHEASSTRLSPTHGPEAGQSDGGWQRPTASVRSAKKIVSGG